MSVPPWVLEGYPIDEPPPEWIVRVLEFSAAEHGVTKGRSHAGLG